MGAFASVLVLVASAGCGGEDDAEARTRCQIESENAARAAVVAAAYEEGRLGTQAEVDADFPGDESIFDSEGNMLLYDDLEGLTRARFDEWAVGGRSVRGEVQVEAAAAKEQVRQDGWPDC